MNYTVQCRIEWGMIIRVHFEREWLGEIVSKTSSSHESEILNIVIICTWEVWESSEFIQNRSGTATIVTLCKYK
jgi:hypothetical protein